MQILLDFGLNEKSERSRQSLDLDEDGLELPTPSASGIKGQCCCALLVGHNRLIVKLEHRATASAFVGTNQERSGSCVVENQRQECLLTFAQTTKSHRVAPIRGRSCVAKADDLSRGDYHLLRSRPAGNRQEQECYAPTAHLVVN